MTHPSHPISLNDVFPAWAAGNNGVISLLEAVGVVPWDTTESTFGSLLDLEYHGNRSGNKIISPLVRKMLDEDGELPILAATNLANLCGVMFGESWRREWAVLSAEYEPIENYDSVEIMTDDETVIAYGHKHTNGGGISHTKTGTESIATTDNMTETPNLTVTETPATTETVTHNTTVTETPAVTETVTHNTTVTETPATTETVTHNTTVTETPTTSKTTATDVYGFDTHDDTPAKSEVVTESYNGTGTNATATTGTEATAKTGTNATATTGTEATAKTGTDTSKTTGTEATAMTGTNTTQTTGTRQSASIGSNSTTYNTIDTDTDTRTDTESGSDTHTRNYELRRHGNIGVTTSQQMLQSEVDFWKWNFFRDIMFPNIDSVFTLCVY